MTERCPYCDSKVEINHDDGYGYEEGELHEQQCDHCDKTFTYQTYISFSYSTYKADCLNGGDHEYKLRTSYPRRYSKMVCSACGHEAPLPSNHPFLQENGDD